MNFIKFDRRALILSKDLSDNQIIANIKSVQDDANILLLQINKRLSLISQILLSVINTVSLFGVFILAKSLGLSEAASILLSLSLTFFLLTFNIDTFITSISRKITSHISRDMVSKIVEAKELSQSLSQRLHDHDESM